MNIKKIPKKINMNGTANISHIHNKNELNPVININVINKRYSKWL